jgi:hypothetical protein
MKNLIVIALFFITISSYGQSRQFARCIIDTLAMPSFYGRGYVHSGDKLAADYIVSVLKKYNIKQFADSYYQSFTIQMNTFPGELELFINKKKLIAGEDYLINSSSIGTKEGKRLIPEKIIILNENTFKTTKSTNEFKNMNSAGNIAVVIDTGFKKTRDRKITEAAFIIFPEDKGLVWSVYPGTDPDERVILHIKRASLPKKIKKMSLYFQTDYYEAYPTQNVAAYVPGKVYPDSFIVFTAHYDHLGMMGKNACFPGANDNASGTAMLLDLAKYYSDPEHQPDYSVAFLFFTAEEAGLLGSEYYTENPLFPLNNIKFLINLDMVGTGSDGIKVVNGSVFKEKFNVLKVLNDSVGLLKTVSERGEASNSDHYYFYKNKVPAFFIYTLGNEYREYHTIFDRAEGLPLTKYEELCHLMILFAAEIQKK